MEFEAIIFDLDGTMWDSAETCTEGWNAALNDMPQLNLKLATEDIRAVMGKTLYEIEDIIFQMLPEKEQRTTARHYCTSVQMKILAKKGGVLYPNLEQTLKALKEKYKLFIVSNCEDGYLDAFFEAHKLNEYFEDYEYWERTGLSKAENIRLVMERNGINSAVYVGDTQGDANSANEAGIPFIYASYGFGNVDTPKYATINAISQLAEIL